MKLAPEQYQTLDLESSATARPRRLPSKDDASPQDSSS